VNTIAEYAVLIREHHLDTFGHVNNAVYLELFEEARWEVISSRGYGIETIKTTGLGPTLLDVHLKFMKELRLREQIVIKTQLVSYEGKVALLGQWIENAAGVRCCEAEFKIGLFDTRQRKLVLPTPEWLKALGIDLA
jgi:thioesterase-3